MFFLLVVALGKFFFCCHGLGAKDGDSIEKRNVNSAWLLNPRLAIQLNWHGYRCNNNAHMSALSNSARFDANHGQPNFCGTFHGNYFKEAIGKIILSKYLHFQNPLQYYFFLTNTKPWISTFWFV